MLKVEIEKKNNRISVLQMLNKIGVLRETHQKTPVPEPLYNEVACPQHVTQLKKRLQHRYFAVVTLHAFTFSRSVGARKVL